MTTTVIQGNRLELFFSAFYAEVSTLKHEQNIAIGGSFALQLHGLNMGEWTPADLDIAIYQPSARQQLILDSVYDQELSYDPNPEAGVMVYKKETGEYKLNIMPVERAQPADLLWYKFYTGERAMMLPVCGITEAVRAKSGYQFNTRNGNAYQRRKDVLHMQTLKNNNFNL